MNRGISVFCAVFALAVIAVCLLGGFASDDPQHAAESLANRRLHILESFFRGDITEKAAEQNLRKIEDEGLLGRDLQELKNTHAAGQDAQAGQRKGLGKIRSIKQKRQYYQYTTYEAAFDDGQNAESKVSVYNLVVKNSGDVFKLTVFEPAKV